LSVGLFSAVFSSHNRHNTTFTTPPPKLNMGLATTFKLNTGADIPAVGFGTWQAAPHEVEKAVEVALKEGYRHIDCAAIYRNEQEVGEGIRKSGVPRDDICTCSDVAESRWHSG